MEVKYQGYLITDERNISPRFVKNLLDDSYWAPDRPIELIEKTIKNSISIGVFHGKDLVGFSRVVTDKATIAWIGDVIVDKAHRGRGLGKEIMKFIQAHPEIPAHSQILRTTDTHGLYEKYGFKRSEIMAK